MANGFAQDTHPPVSSVASVESRAILLGPGAMPVIFTTAHLPDGEFDDALLMQLLGVPASDAIAVEDLEVMRQRAYNDVLSYSTPDRIQESVRYGTPISDEWVLERFLMLVAERRATVLPDAELSFYPYTRDLDARRESYARLLVREMTGASSPRLAGNADTLRHYGIPFSQSPEIDNIKLADVLKKFRLKHLLLLPMLAASVAGSGLLWKHEWVLAMHLMGGGVGTSLMFAAGAGLIDKILPALGILNAGRGSTSQGQLPPSSTPPALGGAGAQALPSEGKPQGRRPSQKKRTKARVTRRYAPAKSSEGRLATAAERIEGYAPNGVGPARKAAKLKSPGSRGAEAENTFQGVSYERKQMKYQLAYSHHSSSFRSLGGGDIERWLREIGHPEPEAVAKWLKARRRSSGRGLA